MTPLEFLISVKNTEAKNGLQEVQQQIAAFKQDAASLYEGPARESKLREELRGMVKDISLGKDPIYVLISSLERLSETFRLAGMAAGALAIGFALHDQLTKAADSATEFFTLFQKGMGVDVKAGSEDALKSLVKNMDDLQSKYEQRGFFEKLIFGGYEDSMAKAASSIRSEAQQRIQEIEVSRIEAHTEALRSMSDADMAQQGEIDAARADLEQKAQQAREQGEEEVAKAYEDQMGAAIDHINAKFAKQRADRLKALDDQSAKAQESLETAGMSPEQLLEHNKAKVRQLEDWISESRRNSPLVDKDDVRQKKEIEVLNLRKEIADQEARLQEEAASKTAETLKTANEKNTAAAEQLNRARSETFKAQYDNLSKEEKLLVLRAEQARLQAELLRPIWSETAREGMKKELADIFRETTNLQKDGNPYRGVNAMDALTGNMASGAMSRVSNDRSARAEQQRDQAVTLLRQIANRDPMTLSAF